MDFDQQRLSRYVSWGLPLAVLVGGWMVFVQPQLSDNARAAREIHDLRQQLAGVRAALADPLPAKPADDAVARFARQTSGPDPVPELLEQLARLAATARVSNLMIETAPRISVDAHTGSGPQVPAGYAADPRLVLFTTPLAYSPVRMAFDAEYARAGDLLWSLRDLATTVEIRDFEARRVAEERAAGSVRPRRIHVQLTLFAYVRQSSVPYRGGSGVLR
jgi:hypothetical protein